MSVSAEDFPAGTPNRLSMRIGCYILFGICTLAILVRYYVRIFIAHKLGLDDFLIITAWAAEVVHIVCVKLQFENGVGWHIVDLATLPNAPTVLTRFILGMASTIVVAGFLCTLLKQVWTTPGTIGGPTCINILSFNYYNAALFLISDILLALAPPMVIMKLQMDVKKKRALAIMFSLGILAIGGTIARQVTNAIAITHVADFTWHWAPTALCSILESSSGIIFVCVPAMAPHFKNWVGESSAAKYTPKDYQSKRPSTFGKIRSKATKLRPDDESILCETHITAIYAKDRDGATGSYEMDQHTSNFTGDGGSERRIITPPLVMGEKKAGGKLDPKGGVIVNTEFTIDRTNRKSVK